VAEEAGWASAEAYESYMGRWSRLVAREFVTWLGIGASARWLDVGCGTGVLTEAILRGARPTHVEGIDPSEEFIQFARRNIRDPRVRLRVADAHTLARRDARYDVVVSGLVLNFVPDPPAAVADMVKASRATGIVAGYVWDYADKMQLIRYFFDAAGALDPDAAAHDEGQRFPICRPEPLKALFGGAGLRDVTVRAIDVPTVFRDFDDYWTPFLAGRFPAPAYAMSLAEEARRALRDRIRAALPTAPDGSIPLIARAWAVRGRRAEPAPSGGRPRVRDPG
jgi:SAM-dependent methyltransferase